ncbi:hypothetical protein [Actinoplanes auranticolor]|uniref:hypothetical protein n=1 Tax=Actinoplanes auranticolor TaxID=47988 RepID=UPI001BB337CC|nr:hypothetical protein [Actinoplanes auranticolor]
MAIGAGGCECETDGSIEDRRGPDRRPDRDEECIGTAKRGADTQGVGGAQQTGDLGHESGIDGPSI